MAPPPARRALTDWVSLAAAGARDERGAEAEDAGVPEDKQEDGLAEQGHGPPHANQEV